MDKKNKDPEKNLLTDEEKLEAISEGMGYESPDHLRTEVDLTLSQETIENQDVDFVFQGSRDCFMLGPRTATAAIWVWDMLAIPPWEQVDYILIPDEILDTTLGCILYDGLSFSRTLH